MSKKLTYRDLLETDGELPEEILEEWKNPFEDELFLLENSNSVEEYEFNRRKLDKKVNEMIAYYENQIEDFESQQEFGILEDAVTEEMTDPLYEKIGEIKAMAYPWYEEMNAKPELFFNKESGYFTEGILSGISAAVILGLSLAITIVVTALELAVPVFCLYALIKISVNRKSKCMKSITEAYKALHPEIIPYQDLDVIRITASKARSLNLKWNYLQKWEADVENLNYFGYFYKGKLRYISAFVKIDAGETVVRDDDETIGTEIYKNGHDHAYVDKQFEQNREYYDNMACFDYGIADVSMKEFLEMLRYQLKHGYNEEYEAIRDYVENDMITEDTITHIMQAAVYGYITEECAQHKIDLIHRIENASFHEEEYL